MFDSKKEKLFDVKENKVTSGKTKKESNFLFQGRKKSAETLSGNFAKKYDTTGNDFVDQFSMLSKYKVPRDFADIEKDMSILWSQNKDKALRLTFFIRMITRQVQLFDGTKTTNIQRGAGLKHESIMRMLWIYKKEPDTFLQNLPLFVSVGSWKDIFQMLSFDLQYHGWDNRILNWNLMFTLIASGLENPKTTDLVKKYLPQIKSNNKCTTIEAQANNMVAKWLASNLFAGKDNKSYVQYRKLKTTGDAHTWQQFISQKKFIEIDFDTVHGRALSLLASSKFLENQNLVDEYDKWISSKPIAKFTGFVHELFGKYVSEDWISGGQLTNMKPWQIKTIQKQFDGLVETAKKNAKTDTSLIVVRDTSGSMSSKADGTSMMCGDIAKSLALFFSEMLPNGHFSNSWIEFSHTARMKEWKGENVVEKWNNDRSSYIGGTDFQSVVDLFVEIKNNGVDETEFPTGILCISDGEFNPSDLNETNVEGIYRKLRSAGFSESYVNNFKIVLWDLRNNYYGPEENAKFETYGSDVKNVYYFSGYEASIIAFLTGVDHQKTEPKNAEELFEAAMDQEILNMLKI
jgi:hypothetical protein